MGLTIQSNVIITKTKKIDIKKIDFATCAEPTETLDKYYARQTEKPGILINGGLFTFATGKPVMDLIDEGKIKSSEDWIHYGLGIDTLGNLIYAKDDDRLWRDFLSAYPPLVVNGQIQTITMAQEISGKARRTILGYDDDYIYTISIDSPGANLIETAIIAQNAGCKYAINLDGGGSTRLLYEGKVYAAASYNRPVDNVVAIYFKKATPDADPVQETEIQQPTTTTTTTIYRVQVGAFSSKANAESYKARIQQLSANYKNAFVTYIAPYYKVQVGAFSVQTNANNMLKDLASKGYNGFIVSEKKTTTNTTTTGGEVKMSNSPLVAVNTPSPNRSTNPRGHKIDTITPHCVVGQCSAEALGAWFAKSSTRASSNYGIDKDGRVGMYVEEQYRSWCSSSTANDDRAITIECASDTFHPYRMNDCVFTTLINLCADICQRYKKKKLIWIDDKDTALAYEPKDDEMILTVHRWFANKACPGDWLYERLGELADKVTAILQNGEDDDEMTQEAFNDMMNNWLVEQAKKAPSDWSAEARKWAEGAGYIVGDENGNKMYKKPLTREEFVQLLYRMKK